MKKALILIDIQNDYFPNGKMTLEGAVEASEKAQQLLLHFRNQSLPIVHIQHVSTRPDATFFIPQTDGVLIHHHVAPLSNEKVIEKHFPNSFRETDLLEHLMNNEITHLVICGMMTHMCIDATVRAAKDFGFTIDLIADACATKDLEVLGEKVSAGEVQKTILAALNYFYASVKNTEPFIRQL